MEFIENELSRIETELTPQSSRTEVIESLRCLGLDDFGKFMFSIPDPRYPRLSQALPRMASEEVQRNWTGNAGDTLLKQTLDFVRSIAYNYCRYSGETLQNKKVLDFGCGYGRVARLMYYFTQPKDFFGIDPWDVSIQICHEDGLRDNFFVSDYLPTALPTGEEKFSLIYAFSVFTHLSQRATTTSIETLLKQLDTDGILVVTIRPIEYWDVDRNAQDRGLVEVQKKLHRSAGFSFLPHNRPAIDGDITYGDTSMTLAWLEKSFPRAKILGIDRSLCDPYQIHVFLKAA